MRNHVSISLFLFSHRFVMTMIIPPAQRLSRVQEYYFAGKLSEISQMREAGHPVINLGIGNPDLMPSEATLETLITSARQPDTHGYQPYRGLPELRKAIADWYERTYAVTLDPTQEVLPLMGSKEGITHLSLAFLNPGDEVLIPSLGYPAYRAVSEMVGATVRTYPLIADTWQPDLENMQQEDYSAVKLLWCNYPHMPTGAPARRETFEGLIQLARTKSLLICHDNPYSLILNERPPLSILSVDGAREVAVELNSLSKSHNMAGWRIGWLAGKAAYLNETIKVKSNVDSGMFRPMQEAAVRALENSASWHDERNAVYRRRREIVYQLLDRLGCAYDAQQQGLFVWAELPPSAPDAEGFVDTLLHEKHIFVTPGFIFGAAGNRYIRLSLCASEATLAEALQRLSA